MHLFEYAALAAKQFKTNRLRCALTVTGIIIGVAAIIAVLSVGAGGRQQINDELSKFGINRYWIYSSSSVGSTGSLAITKDDVELVKRRVENA